MAKIEIVESDEIPVCPHCDKPLAKVLKKSYGSLDTHVVYFCGNCKKVISIGFNRYD